MFSKNDDADISLNAPEYVSQSATLSSKEHLAYALETKNIKQVLAIIKADPSLVNMQFEHLHNVTPLTEAVYSGNYEAVNELIQLQADCNLLGYGDKFPLHWAIINAHQNKNESDVFAEYKKITLLLIEHGADIDKNDKLGVASSRLIRPRVPEWEADIQALLLKIKDKKPEEVKNTVPKKVPAYRCIDWSLDENDLPNEVTNHPLWDCHTLLKATAVIEPLRFKKKYCALALLQSLIEIALNKEFVIEAGLAFERDMDKGIYVSLPDNPAVYVKKQGVASEFDAFRDVIKGNFSANDEHHGDLLRTSKIQVHPNGSSECFSYHPSQGFPTQNHPPELRYARKENQFNAYYEFLIQLFKRIRALSNEDDKEKCWLLFIDNIVILETECATKRADASLLNLSQALPQFEALNIPDQKLTEVTLINDAQSIFDVIGHGTLEKTRQLFTELLKNYTGTAIGKASEVDKNQAQNNEGNAQFVIGDDTEKQFAEKLIDLGITVLGILDPLQRDILVSELMGVLPKNKVDKPQNENEVEQPKPIKIESNPPLAKPLLAATNEADVAKQQYERDTALARQLQEEEYQQDDEVKTQAVTKPQIDTLKAQKPYMFVCSTDTFNKFSEYKRNLQRADSRGTYLRDQLAGKNLRNVPVEDFIESLIQTLPDSVCAEKMIFDPELNWNADELSLLGDLSCIVSTKAYDNGVCKKTYDIYNDVTIEPVLHDNPLDVTLIYMSYPLLRREIGSTQTPDLNKICPNGQFDPESFYNMIETRLLPGLLHTNAAAALKGDSLFVTVPSMGMGYIGAFGKIIHNELERALCRLLTEHGSQLTQIKAIWYDNFDKKPARHHINGIDLIVDPSSKKNGLPQLCNPGDYDSRYTECKLVSFVSSIASKPGGEFWKGSRETDNGIKSSATETLPLLTGYEGLYQADKNMVVPKEAPEKTWSDYMKGKGGVTLKVTDRLLHYPISKPSKLREERKGNAESISYRSKNSDTKSVNDGTKNELLHKSLRNMPTTKSSVSPESAITNLPKDIIDEASTCDPVYTNWANQRIASINSAISTLENKMGQFYNHHGEQAHGAAVDLLTALKIYQTVYSQALRNKTLSIKEAGLQFTNSCALAIQSAKEILKDDLSWGEFLENLFKGLANAVMSFFGVKDSNTLFSYNESRTLRAVEEEESKFTNQEDIASGL